MIILKGFLFGLTLQLSVGPVFFAVINRSLQNSLSAALAMVGGVALADTIYIVLSFTGVSHLLTIPLIKSLAAYAAALILIIFGLSYFHSASSPFTDSQTSLPDTWWAHVLYGLRLTLANPLTIVFWSCTFSTFLVSGQFDRLDLISFGVGCVLSTLIFLSMVSVFGRFLAHLFSPKLITVLNYAVGLFLIGFACRIIITL